ncbi:MAG: sigma-70 family RNA polymerase sigma factor [Planctomycetes bacterium]|nr:sigma-70 family RNA polymerase sigma factor [Planctomycetota bacterium]
MIDDGDALFAGVQRREPEAWARFVDRFGGLVAAVPRRAGLSDADVDDVVQATWVQLLRHAPLIREPRSLPAWVLTTVSRETWRVKGGRRTVTLVAEEDETQAEGDPLDDLARLEAAQLVRDGLSRLGEPCRGLLGALFLRQPAPSYADLADELGIAVGSIGPTRQRCLARLAADLERHGGGLA